MACMACHIKNGHFAGNNYIMPPLSEFNHIFLLFYHIIEAWCLLQKFRLKIELTNLLSTYQCIQSMKINMPGVNMEGAQLKD